MLGAMLVTEHNLSFYHALMQAMRESIASGTFASFASDFRREYLHTGA
jgi:queuine tRNA-ribosyltransferase